MSPAPIAAANALMNVPTVKLIVIAVLRSRRHAAAVSALLVMLYGFLYVVLGIESWALLVGAAALFAALSAVIFATRNVDWHAAGRATSPATPAG